MPARRLSKAALDDLIRETKANEIKGSEYGDLLYTDKKTKVKLQYTVYERGTNMNHLCSNSPGSTCSRRPTSARY
ncbi:hypothetical protein CGMCC3_g5412 [Colletotrichum fructicola]|nr:uncharacterized protein CGMCC3_g5412 [Colletotrichum fructicola]KAE9578264.1 hypothetical protein CGMCC3_g5412 [Colletotrichum fructicola]